MTQWERYAGIDIITYYVIIPIVIQYNQHKAAGVRYIKRKIEALINNRPDGTTAKSLIEWRINTRGEVMKRARSERRRAFIAILSALIHEAEYETRIASVPLAKICAHSQISIPALSRAILDLRMAGWIRNRGVAKYGNDYQRKRTAPRTRCWEISIKVFRALKVDKIWRGLAKRKERFTGQKELTSALSAVKTVMRWRKWHAGRHCTGREPPEAKSIQEVMANIRQ